MPNTNLGRDNEELTLEEIVHRLMANGHSEEVARNCAETHSVVFKYALEAPITRRYLDIQIALLENRSRRYWDEIMADILSRLDRVEAAIVDLNSPSVVDKNEC
jgi:hypothetical protein